MNYPGTIIFEITLTSANERRLALPHAVEPELSTVCAELQELLRSWTPILDEHDTRKAHDRQRVLGLLRDYSKALWAHGQLPNVMDIADQLLDTFDRDTRGVGMHLGKQDFCGIGFGAAQRIVAPLMLQPGVDCKALEPWAETTRFLELAD